MRRIFLYGYIFFCLCALVVLWVAPVRADNRPSFVSVSGQQLVLNGRPITLKGTNYYPRNAPWAGIWSEWDAPATRADLDRAASLGINSLRVLVPGPTAATGWGDAQGNINLKYLNELQQLVQMAGQHTMRVLITLFDFQDFSAAGTAMEASQLNYLRTIVNTFATDDRVLAWDLHNEPDNYGQWQSGQSSLAIDWTYRFARALRTLDKNHPITMGGGRYDSLFVPDNQGRILADVLDIVSIHNYDADAMRDQTEWVRKRTNKPILYEELGWPTGPIMPERPNFTEAEQVRTLRVAFSVAKQFNVVGIMQWQLSDILPHGILDLDDYAIYYNAHFGLFRANSRPKPSAAVYKNEYSAELLPSVTTSNLPLTTLPNIGPGRPYYYPLTDVQVATPFREYWTQHGGFATFGYAITNVTKENGLLVQYFERAKLEFHPERMKDPDYTRLDKNQKYDRLTDVARIGQEALNRSLRAGDLDPNLRGAAESAFGTYVAHHEGSRLFGRVLGAAFLETDPETGTTRAVQYYERGAVEFRPELGNVVRPIRLGLFAARAQNLLARPRGTLPLPDFADASFAQTWRRTDAPIAQSLASRTWLWGPKGFDSTIEEYADSPGGRRQVQYFDKARMEVSHPNAVAVDDGTRQGLNDGDNSATLSVSNGLLVREMISGQVQVGDTAYLNGTPAAIPLAGDPADVNPDAPTYASLRTLATLNGSDHHSPDRTGSAITASLNRDGTTGGVGSNLSGLARLTSYQAATGHNIADVFWSYMNNSYGPVYENDAPTTTNGQVINWLYAVGLPISDPYWTRVRVGGVEKNVLVQAFERRILTYTPTNSPEWRIEMGNVGRHYHQWRYGA